MTDPSERVVCFVALGGNLGDSKTYLKNALNELSNHPDIFDLHSSGFYQSKPHGPQHQPDYINAATRFETTLGAEELLDLLQAIENKNKRVREGVERWGARTLDLDLLLYGDEKIKSKRLLVPHPRICERNFVLFPLQEIVNMLGLGDLNISKTTTLKECIENLPESELKGIEKVSQ